MDSPFRGVPTRPHTGGTPGPEVDRQNENPPVSTYLRSRWQGYDGTHRKSLPGVSPRCFRAVRRRERSFLSSFTRMAMFSSFVSSLRSIAIATASIVLIGPALLAQTSPSVVPSRIATPIDETARVPLHG